jgi:hypothetical protein
VASAVVALMWQYARTWLADDGPEFGPRLTADEAVDMLGGLILHGIMGDPAGQRGEPAGPALPPAAPPEDAG